MVKLRDDVDPWQRVEITVSLADDKLAHTIWWAFIPYHPPGAKPSKPKVSFLRFKGAPLGSARDIVYENPRNVDSDENAGSDSNAPPPTAGTASTSNMMRRRSSRLDGLQPKRPAPSSPRPPTASRT